MDISVYSVKEMSDKELFELLDQKKSFTLTDVEHQKKTVLKLESEIENRGMKCRVYTKGRSATVAAAAIPVSPTVIGGWASALAIGVHNLTTYDPDYEIAKNPIKNSLDINYKKS